MSPYPRVASLKTAAAFRAHLERSSISLEFDDIVDASGALAQPIEVDGIRVGNRFCVLPMEGWDGTTSGEPSDLTRRRWRNFGKSGAKLMWGGEAVAVRHDGRANPNQLMLTPATQKSIGSLRDELISAHREQFGSNADADLYLGLQITHSGRFARPDVWNVPAPLAACPHPILDKRFPGGVRVFTDDELDRLVDDYISAARLAYDCGYQFVDAKACHGYLGHELLGATTRPGSTAARSKTGCDSSPGSFAASRAPCLASASSSGCRSSTCPRTRRAPAMWAYRNRQPVKSRDSA